MPPQAFIPAPLPLAPRKRASRPTPRMCAPRGADTGGSTATPAENHTPSTDWRAFRAHLVAASRASVPAHIHSALPDGHVPATWAHHLPAVEVGAVLLAQERHVWPRAFAHLRHAVVLVTDVNHAGFSGLLLNRPTRFSVGEHRAVLSRVGRVFESNTVHLGGDCSTGTLEVLHGVSPEVCAGAREVVPGVYRGGFNASRPLVQAGKCRADEFRFFVAYSKWTWDQFHAEMDRGAWVVASCAPGLLVGDAVREGGEGLWEDVSSRLEVRR